MYVKTQIADGITNDLHEGTVMLARNADESDEVTGPTGDGHTTTADAAVSTNRRNQFVTHAASMYSRSLLLYFRRRGQSLEDAEDLVQETLFRFCTISDFDSINNVESYLFSTAYRLLVDSYRKDQRTPVKLADAVDVELRHCEWPGAESRLSSQQELIGLMKRVEQLPRQRRRTFVLRKFEELPYKKIADDMGITVGSVRKHLSAAMRDCKQHMQEFHSAVE